MTTFKEIRGTTIEVVSTDPTNPELGQIWYNSSSGTLKGYRNINAWSSGGSINTARSNIVGAGANQNSAIIFSGVGAPYPNILASSESYNGTSWTNTPSLNTGKMQASGCGSTQTAALSFGGIVNPYVTITAATESWNGSSWTSVNSMNTGRRGLMGFGIQTAGVAVGGSQAPGAQLYDTELWNGSSWTTSPATIGLGNGGSGTGFGTQTAGLIYGGGPVYNQSQLFNGSAWTTSPATMNTARSAAAGTGSGTQTAGLIFTGDVPPTNTSTATESWNGTSWTSLSNTSTARREAGGAGVQTSALCMGGAATGFISAGEEWTGIATQTITVS